MIDLHRGEVLPFDTDLALAISPVTLMESHLSLLSEDEPGEPNITRRGVINGAFLYDEIPLSYGRG